MELSRVGITIDSADDTAGLARHFEGLGYGALWIPGGQLRSLSQVEDLLDGTRSVAVGTAIIPADLFPAEDVAATFAGAQRSAPGRFLVGLGGPQQAKPLPALHRYLDRLDDADVPAESRLLAALGPRKLALAAERSAGVITLLVTPDFTERTRHQLGEDGRQIVQLPVVAETDPTAARAAGRQLLGFLLQVPGYRAHAGRLGFADAEIERIDDRLVDALVAWGDADAIAAAARRHLDAGADQVIINPVGGPASPGETAEDVADALGLRPPSR